MVSAGNLEIISDLAHIGCSAILIVSVFKPINPTFMKFIYGIMTINTVYTINEIQYRHQRAKLRQTVKAFRSHNSNNTCSVAASI